MRIGDYTMTPQPQPEFTQEFLRALAAARRSVVGDDVADAAFASMAVAQRDHCAQ